MLTVAVSVTAGAVAVTSAAPGLLPYRSIIALSFVLFITLANLRGVKESGMLFAVPTYAFIVSMMGMVALGLLDCLASGCPRVEPVEPIPGLAASGGAVGLFVLLHAFSSGSTALTGVEAISDGVAAFRRPQARNAAQTLAIMGAIGVTMFLGISFLATHTNVTVSEERSVVAQIADAVFHGGIGFYVVQTFTALILILASNTAYQDFPRLSSILAKDDFVPHQFKNRGDRLVFSNGVIVLAVLASALIVAFKADLSRLIQLYVVGVFTSFTLSQAGMVRRWLRLRHTEEAAGKWKRSIVINAVGATATGVVLVVVIATKFLHGAWIVIAALPFIIWFFLSVRRHYASVEKQLGNPPDKESAAPGLEIAEPARNHVVMLVPDLDAATAEALGYVRSFRPSDLHVVHPCQDGMPAGLQERWRDFCRGGPALEPLSVQDGQVLEAVRGYLRRLARGPRDFVTVVLPELIRNPSLLYLARRPDLVRLKAGLLREPNIVVTDVPVSVEQGVPVGVDGRPLIPERTVALVPVSRINKATTRAVEYARSLRAASTRALYVALDPEESINIVKQWTYDIPLDVVEAPFRDLGPPLLEEVRRITARHDTVAAVVIPEVLVKRWWHLPLHNQTALFIKRLLLFEPRVVLSSVPFLLE